MLRRARCLCAVVRPFDSEGGQTSNPVEDGFKKNQIVTALQALLDDGGFHIQDRPLVEEALALYKHHAGQFSDHLLGAVAKQEGASTTYTFDKGVAKLPNFTLLK